jgi:N-acetylglucosaminyl-diphospho-decaprenol L-rhamnosyltransferase
MAPSLEQSVQESAAERNARPLTQTYDVCVVTFNSAASIRCLLGSLAGDSALASVRILDNASEDDTVEVVGAVAASLGLPTHLTPSQRNLGFPAASNVLLKQCDADVVVLVNPDVELRPGVLSELVEAVASDRSIGVAACRLMTRDERPQSEPARSRPRLRRLLAGELPHWIRAFASRRRGHRGGSGPLYAERDVECSSGALMVVRRELLETIGYLDESVFMYLEDIDFAARVRRAGYRIRYLGRTWAWHDSGVSAQGHESPLFALLPQVWLTYLARYGPWPERLAARPVLLVVCVMAMAKRMLRAEVPRGELLALWRTATFRPAREPSW